MNSQPFFFCKFHSKLFSGAPATFMSPTEPGGGGLLHIWSASSSGADVTSPLTLLLSYGLFLPTAIKVAVSGDVPGAVASAGTERSTIRIYELERGDAAQQVSAHPHRP